MATIDHRLLLAGRGIDALDPMELEQKSLVLSNLARAGQMQQYEFDAKKRAEENTRAIGDVLGNLDVSDDAAVINAMQRVPPEARAAFRDYVLKSRDQLAKTRKESAMAGEHETKNKAAQYAIVGGIAGTLAQEPTREGWQAARATIGRLGMDPSILDVPDGVEPSQHFMQIANGAMTRAQQLEAEDKKLGRSLTARGQDITMRGQDMTDARTRELTAAQLAQAKWMREAGMAQVAATREAGRAQANDASGTPQEIVVNGVPTLAIYDKRSGTFFDANTRQPIKEGLGPKSGELPASIREKMAQNNVTLTKLDNAIAALESNPDAVGLKNYLPDAAVQRFDPKGVEARAMIADIAGQKIHDRSGAAVTIGEMERLKAYIPNIKDAPDAVAKKLGLLRNEYAQVQEELAAGRSVAELVKRAPKAGAATDRDTLVREAMDAIKKGAPREKVLQRLLELGVTDARI